MFVDSDFITTYLEFTPLRQCHYRIRRDMQRVLNICYYEKRMLLQLLCIPIYSLWVYPVNERWKHDGPNRYDQFGGILRPLIVLEKSEGTMFLYLMP